MRFIILLLLIPFISISQNNDVQKAQSLFSKGDYEKAVQIYEKLPSNKLPRFYSSYLYSLNALSKYKEAKKVAQKMYLRDKNNLRYLSDVIIFERKNDDKSQASKNLNILIKELKTKPSQALTISNNFNRNEMYDFAIKVLDATENDNNRSNYLIQKAENYSSLLDYEKMITCLLDLLEYNASRELYVRNKFQKTIYNFGIKNENFNKSLKKLLISYSNKNSKNPIYSDLLVWYFIQNKNYEMAYRQSVSMDLKFGDYDFTLLDIASLFQQEKKHMQANKVYNYIISKNKKDKLFYQAHAQKINLAFVSDNQQLIKEVRENYDNYELDFPLNKITVNFYSAYAKFQALHKNDYESSEKIFLKILNLDNIKDEVDVAEAKLNYSDILVYNGRIWEALIYYSQVEKKFKENPIGHQAKLKIAKVYYYNGDFEVAQAQLDVLKRSTSKLISNDAIDLSLLITDNLSLDTTDIVMRMYAKAEMLAYQRKYIEALSLYDSLINKYQFHSLVDEALFEKYKIYYELEDFDNCIFALNKILDYSLNDILADDATYFLAKIYDEKINDINLALLNYNIIIEKFQGSIYYDFSRKKIKGIQIKQNDNL
jgi:tetratricopeptide (TPR) repeat protein